MVFLRSLLHMIVLIVSVTPWSFVVLSGWLFPVHTRYKLCSYWTRFAIWSARWICGVKYEVRGWGAWHRYITLCLLAHAYLAIVSASARRDATDACQKGALLTIRSSSR